MKYLKRIEQYRSGKTQRQKNKPRDHKKSDVVDSNGGSAEDETKNRQLPV